MRWVGTLVLLAILAGAAFIVVPALRDDGPKGGLEVLIEVVDPLGRPVSKARVQARYAPGWHAADAEGRVHLEGVRLRVEETATPEAVRQAIEAEAPSHARRREEDTHVERIDENTWRVRTVLDPFGRLRLVVRDTALPEVRAWVQADPLLGRVVAEGGIAVARPGQPASWRVFAGVETLDVHLEGMTGVALRSRRIETPNTGFTREIVLEAEEAQPITGQVVLRGVPVPDLGGRIEVFELQEGRQETRQPYDVRVAHDGSFRVPFAAKARYRLVPRLDFAMADPIEADGGDVVAIEASGARPWLAAPVTSHETNARRAVYEVERLGGAEPWHGTWTRLSGGRLLVALPGPGLYALTAQVMGDANRAPLHGSAEVEVRGPGAHPIDLAMTPVASGTVRIHVQGGPATVELTEPVPPRKQTVLPRLSDAAVFAHVPVGSFCALVRWRDEATPLAIVRGTVKEGETVEVEAAVQEGAHVRLEGRGDAVWRDSRDRILRLTLADDLPCRIRCRRLAGTCTWRSVDRIPLGRYAAVIHPLGAPEALEAQTEVEVSFVSAPLEFEIR